MAFGHSDDFETEQLHLNTTCPIFLIASYMVRLTRLAPIQLRKNPMACEDTTSITYIPIAPEVQDAEERHILLSNPFYISGTNW